jgi:hypothetical protein
MGQIMVVGRLLLTDRERAERLGRRFKCPRPGQDPFTPETEAVLCTFRDYLYFVLALHPRHWQSQWLYSDMRATLFSPFRIFRAAL